MKIKVPTKIAIFVAIVLVATIYQYAIAAPNYTLKNLDGQYYVDWVGNSFSAAKTIPPRYRQHIQQYIEDIYVTPNGTVYSNARWDERFAQASGYRNGNQTVIMDKMMGNRRRGGFAVTADQKYVYVSVKIENANDRFKLNKYGRAVYPEQDNVWYGIRRYRAKSGKIAGFKEGKGIEAGLLVVNSDAGHIQGLAIHERHLYVSDTPNNQIKIYNLNHLTQEPILTWSVKNPGKLAFDREGQLWVVRHKSNRISRYSPQGKIQPQEITLPKNAIAYDIAIDRQNNLLVTDLGQEQNIKIYENIASQPKLKGTFGQKGGIFSPSSGEFTINKFYKPKGVGIDSKGNIFVAQDAWSSRDGGGTIIESYQPNGKLRWRVCSLEFISSLDIDPSEEWLYSKERIYQFDKAQKPGLTAIYHGTTLNPTEFPDDPRLHLPFIGVEHHNIDRKPLLFMLHSMGRSIAMFRFDRQNHGEVAIPYAMFTPILGKHKLWNVYQPKNEEWIWIDRNLDGQFDADEFTVNNKTSAQKPTNTTGWSIQSDGTLWNVAKRLIRKFPAIESDKGYPVWDFTNAEEFKIPSPFLEVRRILYEEETDSMYLTGYTADATYTGEWKAIGKKIARFNNWSSLPTLEWISDTPWYYNNGSSREKPLAVDIEGDYVFIGLGSTGKNKNLYQQSTVFVYDKAAGKYIGSMQHQGQVGPIMLDKATGINTTKTKNGEYLIFLADAAYARSIIFHWTPNK